ncbi:hypothetical protein H6504_00050 [Candidatus Woesearchaeota archaeon]|nr:hypothetical protein [Candidatus Woesearchaeota archaeon]
MLYALGIPVVASGLLVGLFLEHIAHEEVKHSRKVLQWISAIINIVIFLYAGSLVYVGIAHWVLITLLLILAVPLTWLRYGVLGIAYGMSGFDPLLGGLVFVSGFPAGSLEKKIWVPFFLFMLVSAIFLLF